ncbi:MAG: response regulator [Planctomycetes bacterium]|nr:response regulator [Planctomycetota bacterium]
MPHDQNVWLVEHDKPTRMALGRLLRSKGWQVRELARRSQAVPYWRTFGAPDLVILDAAEVGETLAQDVRMFRRLCGPGLPVVVLTAKASLAQLAEAYVAGASFCLTQPLDTELLAKALEYILDDLPPKRAGKIELELLTADGFYFG